MKLEIPDYVRTLMDALDQNGYECFIVGGAVRSMLLNLPVHDYDLTTNALPQQMKEVFHSCKTIDTGLKHGTLTVLSKHHPIEITTYRKDSAYQDHRHPDAVQFTSAIEEDCARRDFTINAFCYNEHSGLLDFFQGEKDLHAKILRCIGDPSQRFEEDALRILRAIRFAAQLDFQIEPQTKEAIFAKKDLLTYISLERIHDEMNGFLHAPACAAYLDTYRPVLNIFFPEIMYIANWSKVLQAVDRAVPDANIRMAVLLSSIADPAAVLRRLKYANNDIRQIVSMTGSQNANLSDRIHLRKFLSTYKGDFSSYLKFRSAMDPSFPQEAAAQEYSDILAKGDCISLSQLKIKGTDIKNLGYQGKQISDLLEQMLNAVMEDQVCNQKEQLLAYIKRED